MIVLDASLLRGEYSRTRSEGLCAEFYPDGQLRHFGFYRQGRLVGPAISLEHGRRAGVLERRQEAPYLEPTTITDEEGNEVEATEEALEQSFLEWVKSGIEKVYRAAGSTLHFSCSFCSKSRTEVRRLIAGPEVFICDECVGLCVEILAEEDAAAGRKAGEASRRP